MVTADENGDNVDMHLDINRKEELEK